MLDEGAEPRAGNGRSPKRSTVRISYTRLRTELGIWIMVTEIRQFDPATAGWEPYTDDGFIGLIGPWWQRQSGDVIIYGFLAEPKHHNRRGIVQGGMLMAFADRSMGLTAWHANQRRAQATIQL